MYLRFAVVIALILFGVGFYAWQTRDGGGAPVDNNMPAFVPPVYGIYGDEKFIALPLLFGNVPTSGLSVEQTQKVTDFKKHIFTRIVSKIPLQETEKTIISTSAFAATKQDTDGIFAIGQDILQFTEDELRLISEALSK